MNKEQITVSAEVRTFLFDLYSQIEYELQEQYNDEVQNLQQRIQKAIEYIKENDNSELGIYQTKFIGKDKLLKILTGDK